MLNVYDPVLLQDARAGDSVAIEQLLMLAQPDIRRYAQRTCYAADDVNDAVQEALWVLYRKVGTLRNLASFSGWLFAVVRRECIRLGRSMPGRQVDLADAEREDELLQRSTPELRVDLARAIESLPPHYRQVVLLRDVQECTIAEIACTLGRTHEGTKAILHRARLLLREYLLPRPAADV